MDQTITQQSTQLNAALSQGISVVQMVVYKKVRDGLRSKYADQSPDFQAMLAGAITNELFGLVNEEARFVHFRKENFGGLEQELLTFATDHPDLLGPLTDALRIQVLCDSQEGLDSSYILSKAQQLGILQEERDIPLPTTFMTMVRNLGAEHHLITPPVPNFPDQDTPTKKQ